MKKFRFNIICNITQELQELQRYNRAYRFIYKSAVIKYHQLMSTITSIVVFHFMLQLNCVSSSLQLFNSIDL